MHNAYTAGTIGVTIAVELVRFGLSLEPGGNEAAIARLSTVTRHAGKC